MYRGRKSRYVSQIPSLVAESPQGCRPCSDRCACLKPWHVTLVAPEHWKWRRGLDVVAGIVIFNTVILKSGFISSSLSMITWISLTSLEKIQQGEGVQSQLYFFWVERASGWQSDPLWTEVLAWGENEDTSTLIAAAGDVSAVHTLLSAWPPDFLRWDLIFFFLKSSFVEI